MLPPPLYFGRKVRTDKGLSPEFCLGSLHQKWAWAFRGRRAKARICGEAVLPGLKRGFGKTHDRRVRREPGAKAPFLPWALFVGLKPHANPKCQSGSFSAACEVRAYRRGKSNGLALPSRSEFGTPLPLDVKSGQKRQIRRFRPAAGTTLRAKGSNNNKKSSNNKNNSRFPFGSDNKGQ
jgi:hypothetical protein